MDCPHCRGTLREVIYEGALIRTCDGCGGEFLSADALRHVVAAREMRFDVAQRSALRGRKPRFGVPACEVRRRLDCPACGGAMEVGSYGGDSGVFVDRCHACNGLWLDRDELEHVQILVERWADEAPEQIRHLAAELEAARRDAAASVSDTFTGSRFAFVNAIINRMLDAA